MHPHILVPLFHRAGISPQSLMLCLADLTALLMPATLVFLLRATFGDVNPALYRWVFPMLLLGPLLGVGFGLYQSVSLPPPRELKSLFLLATLLYGLILTVLFLSQTGRIYSRLIIAGSWLITVFALPGMRACCRRLFAARRWWGRPLLIFDHGEIGRGLWHFLKRHPERGLTPVDIFALPDDVRRTRELLSAAAARYPGAVVLIPHMREKTATVDYIKEAGRWFTDILTAPVFCGSTDVHWITICDLGPTAALWIRQNLCDKRRLLIKRCIDLVLCFASLPVLLPLGLILAAAIRLDSAGPMLYRQKRVGLGGKEMQIYKFRTMVTNADTVLLACLASDQALHVEWERDHKMKRDPRVTRVGAFLRKTSLDELPQVINVLAGTMSLVGPRPIVAEEKSKYNDVYKEYCRVRPGITGLWQISGRNDTTYAERVAFDHYYICNWSVWMDLWILGKTVPVALSGYGAY
ncbi:undecaprenyl-phosphate galactose phosphotransferase WbaP [Deltaproteobacteria bacterium]|nr:undecaprenyl-phosphate galactose phosphotransferase WbaP [Deltaproteobacteria bacterium]